MRGHWRDALGWISDPEGASALEGDPDESFGSRMGSRIEGGLGRRREEANREEAGNRGNPDRSDIVTPNANPERARLRSSFLGVLRVWVPARQRCRADRENLACSRKAIDDFACRCHRKLPY